VERKSSLIETSGVITPVVTLDMWIEKHISDCIFFRGEFRNFHRTKPEPRRQRKLILYSHPLKRGASITTVKTTEALANSSEETRSVFYCPESPKFIWDFNHTTPCKITVAITSIACTVTILLNLLVIIAAKTRRELKQVQISCCLAWP